MSYRLPTSFVVVAGTVVRTVDELADVHPDDWSAWDISLRDYSVAVVTEGDGPAYLVSPARGNWLWSYRGSFATTVDGRLISASGESTGSLSTVVKSVIGVAGAVLGVRRSLLEGPAAASEDTRLEAAFGASRWELDRYALEHPAEYGQARRLVSVVATLQETLVEAIQEGFLDGSDPNRATQLGVLEPVAGAALTRLKAHYASWRASKIVAFEDKFEIRQRVDDVPTELPEPGPSNRDPSNRDPSNRNRASPGDATLGDSTGDTAAQLPTDLVDFWLRFGIGITAFWPQRHARDALSRAQQSPRPGSEDEYVLVRRPDLMELFVTKRASVPHSKRFHRSVISRSRHWVADATSEHRWLRLEKSFWGRRSLRIEFDADGFLRGVSTNSDASLAKSLTALADAPGSVAGGLEAVAKADTALSNPGR